MSASPPLSAGERVERVRISLAGAVQGVGMRPHVFALAKACGLAGFVANGADGVTIEVEGSDIGSFVARLTTALPPLARIDRLRVEPLAATGGAGFVIADSTGGLVRTRIGPDAPTCDACLNELFDPDSRFFGYPFLNCTHCGPRFTITRQLPYDRPQTSMAGFPLCAACAGDYADPANRRFHAEPIACPACGPQLTASIAAIAETVRAGRIVALKGIGGYHLMCDARNESAVALLRGRKQRPHKPFAVMVANGASIGTIADASANERELAASPVRPIVLMRGNGAFAGSVAPGLTKVGVLLAYAPVHHLLFAELAGGLAGHDPARANPVALIATSANPGGEPLVVEAEDAARRLACIADLIVDHNRPIVVRADDSVAQIVAGAPALLRRARGFVPEPIELTEDGPDVLALGAHLKNTVTFTRGREAFVSQHIGDLDTAETVRFWRETIDRMMTLLDVRPEAVACDLHPDYRSSQMAADFGLPVRPIQHHAAHIAAVAAEQAHAGPLLGLALDGHGHGPQGDAWGGELLRLGGADWQRLGGLAPLPMPGGDRAAREPWRMGVGAMAMLRRGDLAAERFPTIGLAGPVAARLAKTVPGLATSSLGRLFDAVAALLGVATVQSYEGQAATELEALVRRPRRLDGGWRIDAGTLSLSPLLTRFIENPPDPAEGAELFHGTLIEGLVQLAADVAARTGHAAIALGGGCLMNRTLTEGLVAGLAARGLTPLVARKLPPNDGGLSFGQAVLARRASFEGI